MIEKRWLNRPHGDKAHWSVVGTSYCSCISGWLANLYRLSESWLCSNGRQDPKKETKEGAVQCKECHWSAWVISVDTGCVYSCQLNLHQDAVQQRSPLPRRTWNKMFLQVMGQLGGDTETTQWLDYSVIIENVTCTWTQSNIRSVSSIVALTSSLSLLDENPKHRGSRVKFLRALHRIANGRHAVGSVIVVNMFYV